MRPEELDRVLALLVRRMLANLIEEMPMTRVTASTENSPLSGLSPQEQEWSRKAILKYAAAQEKQWRRWNESMFEPK
jgi:hypothetical protein